MTNKGRPIFDPFQGKDVPHEERATYPVWAECPECRGSGEGVSRKVCVHCDGRKGRRMRFLACDLTPELLAMLPPKLRESAQEERFLLEARNRAAKKASEAA